MTDKSHDERMRAVAEQAWQQWTHGGAAVKDGIDNHAVIQAIGKAVIDSYIAGMNDEEWLNATLDRLETERGGTAA
jgi:hypothetical protein